VIEKPVLKGGPHKGLTDIPKGMAILIAGGKSQLTKRVKYLPHLLNLHQVRGLVENGSKAKSCLSPVEVGQDKVEGGGFKMRVGAYIEDEKGLSQHGIALALSMERGGMDLGEGLHIGWGHRHGMRF
jgi:hypothetical protein